MKIKTQSLELLGISAVIAVVVGIRACGSGDAATMAPPPVIEVRTDTVVPDSNVVRKTDKKKTRRQPVSRDFLDEKIERR